MIAKLNANPLARFEIQAIKRRQHIGSTFTSFEKWLFRLAMILAIGFLVIGIGAVIVAPALITTPENTFQQIASPFAWSLVLLAVFFHFRLMLVTLSLGIETIVRANSTAWEHIVLSGMSARQVMLGKWWAIIRLVWRRYLWLAVIRAGAIIALGLVVFRQIPFFFTDIVPQSDLFWRLSLAALLTFGITLVNAAFTAAAGVGGALRNDGTTPNLSTAFATRATGVIILAVPLAVIMAQLIVNEPIFTNMQEFDDYRLNDPRGILTTLSMVMIVSLIDSGAIAGGATANPFDFIGHFWFLGLVFVFIAQGVLTVFVFWLTQRSAHKKGLLR